MKNLKVLFYDNFFDIPLRGIALSAATRVAFLARLMESESNKNRERPGVIVKIEVFECGAELYQLFEKKDQIFGAWRQQFDKNESPTSSHPMYVNSTYQEICRKIDTEFAAMNKPVSEKVGTMNVVSGSYFFQELGE